MADATKPAEFPEGLFELVYQELRRIARGQRRAAGSPATLDTTALVHEVYLKLHASSHARSLDRAHFVSLAARAMRQILVDNVRRRSRLRRGGGIAITQLDERIGMSSDTIDLLALDAALNRLSELDARAGQLVEWHIFGGLGVPEIAQMLNITERTVFRDWRRARAFLVQQLGRPEAPA